MRFSGSFTPLITPFDRKGRLDKRALEKLVEWQISEGSDGIVCSATTGEGPCLSDADRKNIAEICVRTAEGRISVIAATGINDTRTSVRYTEIAMKLGVDGCLVVTPYYNKPSQQGCILHFSEVAKVGLPIILYHNPPRAAIRLTADTILKLSRIPNIVAIKDSSHDLDLVRQISKQIDVFAGDDDIAFEAMKLGAVGTITPSSNLIPRGWKKMVSLCLQNKWDEAQAIAKRYLPLGQAIFLETNPQCVKFAVSWLGRCQPIFRLPMINPTDATQKEIKKAIVRLALVQFSQIKTAQI
jgi:4-hydroxy-tetrahydrodipicolinate synthase